MSDLNLENIVGFKAVDKNGNERQVTVDEMTELVSAGLFPLHQKYQHLLPLRQPEQMSLRTSCPSPTPSLGSVLWTVPRTQL